eukprot:TRINITY_DN58096_c0_g1_i3.p1 TRINITY_DN58096_c0_g1~~TRINITY_DN58096_c0_g1_i3.p1  ORF type:complete len:196 (+),score=41.16 TRINITY_DN58096_c0_g1_i3:57-644(+)
MITYSSFHLYRMIIPYCNYLALFFFFFFKQKTAYEMLRSLVGSEMCIRDSLSIKPPALSSRPTTGGEGYDGGSSSSGGQQYYYHTLDIGTIAISPTSSASRLTNASTTTIVSHPNRAIPGSTSSMFAASVGAACLLYTSDAADEEDSVDLGGRRIIKKKKKEESNINRILKEKALGGEREVLTNRLYVEDCRKEV